MPLTIFGWIRKPKDMPPTVLGLVIEEEVDVRHIDNRIELVVRPKSIPEVILTNENGLTRHAELWYWDIGAFWYDYSKKTWIASLSMTTNLYNTEGKLIAEGFNGEENHMGTDCLLAHGQRLHFQRVSQGFYRDSPVQYYPKVTVKILCRECNEPRR